MDFLERFWYYVVKGEHNECWEWKGAKLQNKGYGRLTINLTDGINKTKFAHRLSYELHHPLTKSIHNIDLCVCHSCDNPGCVNPYHLRLDTPKNNIKERDDKGRGGKPRFGEANNLSNGLLDDEMVKEIRFKYDIENISQQKLSEEYNVSRGCIGHIVRKETWKHILPIE
jgi:hypothetical protein